LGKKVGAAIAGSPCTPSALHTLLIACKMCLVGAFQKKQTTTKIKTTEPFMLFNIHITQKTKLVRFLGQFSGKNTRLTMSIQEKSAHKVIGTRDPKCSHPQVFSADTTGAVCLSRELKFSLVFSPLN
jgi:hypothetical protein